MRVVHLLRKCNPAEWGGTETAVQRLMEGLREHDVASAVYCPHVQNGHAKDPLTEAGWTVRRFRTCVPVWGIGEEQKRQFVAVGGNLMSFDLLPALWREPAVDVVHSHTLGRLGAMALNVAKLRRLPFVVTIHGGLMDLPEAVKKAPLHPQATGLEWGKLFSVLLRTHRFLTDADAVVACNEKEAALLRERRATKRIWVQPHGVFSGPYQEDHRAEARQAFPQIHGHLPLLSVGRIDPVKNQGWLIEQAETLLQRHPRVLLILAGACTNTAYGEGLRQTVRRAGLQERVLFTGGLPQGDPRLIGLMQEARAVILPSISETFGMVVLEAWAAGAPVIASRTSGASALIRHFQNGWLFDLDDPKAFHTAIDGALLLPDLAKELAAAGQRLVRTHYDATLLAGRMKNLYAQLIEEKNALRHHPRRRHECVDAA